VFGLRKRFMLKVVGKTDNFLLVIIFSLFRTAEALRAQISHVSIFFKGESLLDKVISGRGRLSPIIVGVNTQRLLFHMVSKYRQLVLSYPYKACLKRGRTEL